jgi:hypothetical protein
MLLAARTKRPFAGLPYVFWIARRVFNKRRNRVSGLADQSMGSIPLKPPHQSNL